MDLILPAILTTSSTSPLTNYLLLHRLCFPELAWDLQSVPPIQLISSNHQISLHLHFLINPDNITHLGEIIQDWDITWCSSVSSVKNNPLSPFNLAKQQYKFSIHFHNISSSSLISLTTYLEYDRLSCSSTGYVVTLFILMFCRSLPKIIVNFQSVQTLLLVCSPIRNEYSAEHLLPPKWQPQINN